MSCFGLVFALLLAGVHTALSDLSSGPHITDVNILLPPKMTHPVEYRLQGSDGCFKWSWDHHDILAVVPEYNTSNHCSTSARLRSIAPFSGRKETAVYATDVNTGIVVRCKVFIDNFSRIQIFHSSIKLDLDGLATLRVHAFDREENVFSSLVGLQFMWQLTPEITGLPHHLTHVPLKVSPLSDCGGLCGDLDVQIEIEDGGVFSDLFVVKGVGIGHEVVSVHLMEPGLEHVQDKIVLTVAEAIAIEPPSPVFVLIGAEVHYRLKVIRANIPQTVPLPSPHYRWSVLNSSVAHVDPVLGVTNALSLGITTISVEDTRVAGHVQGSSFHVVLPDTIRLFISPLSSSSELSEGLEALPWVARWYIVSGRQYIIQMKVFSGGPDAHEIYITENDDVNLFEDQSDYWKIFLLSEDIVLKHGRQNYRMLKATSTGLGKLTASLSYFWGNDGMKKAIKVVQEVMVCDEVQMILERRNASSHSIVLPWIPGIHQVVQLKATGGCAKSSSDFKWYSSDMEVASVSPSGVLQAKQLGKATIRVASAFDLFNYNEVIVEVSMPSSMIMLPNFPVEAVVGSHLKAAVTLKASNGEFYYRCDAFNSHTRWKAGSESFIIINATAEPPNFNELLNPDLPTLVTGPPCSWTYVYAAGPGQTMLHATISKDFSSVDHVLHGPTVLKASSHIAAYAPLLVHQAGDGNQFGGYWRSLDKAETGGQLENINKLYLAPGTHLDVLLVGGPERWGGGVDYVEAVDSFDKDHAYVEDELFVQQLLSNHQSFYRVHCHMPGDFDIVFKRGNLIGDDHPLPTIAEASLLLKCSAPSSIVLIADEPVNEQNIIKSAIQAERGPGRTRSTPVTVANGRVIRISAVGITSAGEALANSSSFDLKWELNNCDQAAYWDESKRSPSVWERFLVLQNESGLCIVRATVMRSGKIMNLHDSIPFPASSEEVLTDAIRLQLVSALRVSPEYNLLYFNPDAKINLSISGGSCFLESAVNDSKVVEIIPAPPSLQCSQLLLSPRGLGTAILSVNDIGVVPQLSASATVRVADVDWLKITSGDEITLMEGSAKTIDILAGTNDGSSFDHSQFTYMNIHVHIEERIVEIASDYDVSTSDDGCIKGPSFVVIAKQLGITNLFVSFKQQSGHMLLSQQIKIEVYAPPVIHPHDIFLAPGASYVVAVKGGPTVGVHIVYASSDDRIATVHQSSGRLFGVLLGNSTITARIYGKGETMICQADAVVTIGIPSSAMLQAQSEQIAVGREMPVYPLFSEADLFSLYELCRDFKWKIEDEKVLRFDMIEDSQEEMHLSQLATSENTKLAAKELNFINILVGRSAGRTKVAVSFSCDFVSASFSKTKSYSSSLSIMVVPDPPLALGIPVTWILPPNYVTSRLLPSSSELYDKHDKNRKGSIVYSLLRNWVGNNGIAQNDAISIYADRVKTAGSNDLACIQANDRTTGRIEIASCVRVAEVSQVRISDKEFPSHMLYLAYGAEVDLPVYYYDALGYPFHEAYNAVSIDIDINDPDVVLVNDTNKLTGSIRLKAVQHGRALLRVSMLNNLLKADYMLISVGAHIYPQNPVVRVGTAVNFTIQGLNEEVSGQWISGNRSVVYVDILSGKSKAVGEGSTQVIFQSRNIKLETTLSVLRGDTVTVSAPVGTLTNVPFPLGGYQFSVQFRNPYSSMVEVLKSKKEIPYDCIVDPAYVGYAKPWIDLYSGNTYCLFFPYSPEHLVHSVYKSRGIRSDISFSVNAISKEPDNASGSASALFVGGFSIQGMGQDKMHLNLTPDSNKTILTILGNTDIEIHWRARHLIKINLKKREDFGLRGSAEYEVEALRPENFRDSIIISLPATGQRTEIDVSYTSGEKKPTLFGNMLSASSSILLALLLLILTVGIFLCILSRPGRTQLPPPAGPPSTPQRLGPVTPNRSPGSGGVADEKSPKTPQPFMEYVRRTIDETPYYRRDGGRRRFNPQATY